MSWYLVFRLLHILAAAATIGGIIARQLVRGMARRSDDVKTIASLTQVAHRLDRTMVIPGSNLLFLIGIVLAVIGKWPIFGFLQGAAQNWLLASNILLVVMMLIVPAVFLPYNKKLESLLHSSPPEGSAAPQLRALLEDSTNRWAHHAEELIVFLIAALMVLKPF